MMMSLPSPPLSVAGSDSDEEMRIESDPAEDARQYLLEREEKLSQTFACVLVDQANVPTQRSLRWHVLPARP